MNRKNRLFTENISRFALQSVVKTRKTQLFYRALNAVDGTLNLVHEEKLLQYRLAMKVIPGNMTLKQGQLKAMQEIFKRYRILK
ncbi:hypothetical protein PHMEG_00029661 [Phytophthora megakarya]|uniref:Uncharacterized protein n=1 Tax=Phytophthora megakarya TaxID=4795 RepID=A0A225V215_9STRA|nr:hypothetical protein PHMEG_00029661 [Phytophthora megakarya]